MMREGEKMDEDGKESNECNLEGKRKVVSSYEKKEVETLFNVTVISFNE